MRFYLAELRIIKRAVEAAERKKLFVVALLAYSSVADNENLIRVLYRGQAQVRCRTAYRLLLKRLHSKWMPARRFV